MWLQSIYELSSIAACEHHNELQKELTSYAILLPALTIQSSRVCAALLKSLYNIYIPVIFSSSSSSSSK